MSSPAQTHLTESALCLRLAISTPGFNHTPSKLFSLTAPTIWDCPLPHSPWPRITNAPLWLSPSTVTLLNHKTSFWAAFSSTSSSVCSIITTIRPRQLLSQPNSMWTRWVDLRCLPSTSEANNYPKGKTHSYLSTKTSQSPSMQVWLPQSEPTSTD